jgi:DNA-binding beta-propeller fold protein YncE
MTRTTTAWRLATVVLAMAGLGACDDGAGGGGAGPAAGHYLAELADTLLLGAADNAEVVKAIPGTDRAVLVSSKARKLTLLQVGAETLVVLREATLFENDDTESELTHVAVSPDGAWAACTRTLIETDGDGAQTDCGGELVFVDVTDSADFGTIRAQVPVGPMPDAAAVSPDGTWVAVANERDGPDAWGKCVVAGEVPSVSVVEVPGGDPAAAVERHRVTMVDADTGPREPETVAFSKDGDLVVATLQDSHELVMFRISDLDGIDDPTSELAAVTIVALPGDAAGAFPWPDGVERVVLPGGGEVFAVAGEWNDTFLVVDPAGQVLANKAITPADLPADLPRVIDEGTPLFSPDSVASFTVDGHPHVAFTLRHAGAVVIYDLTDPAAPVYVSAVAVGKGEAGGQDEDGSTIRPEGVAAAADGAWLITANEEESSVSLAVAH